MSILPGGTPGDWCHVLPPESHVFLHVCLNSALLLTNEVSIPYWLPESIAGFHLPLFTLLRLYCAPRARRASPPIPYAVSRSCPFAVLSDGVSVARVAGCARWFDARALAVGVAALWVGDDAGAGAACSGCAASYVPVWPMLWFDVLCCAVLCWWWKGLVMLADLRVCSMFVTGLGGRWKSSTWGNYWERQINQHCIPYCDILNGV